MMAGSRVGNRDGLDKFIARTGINAAVTDHELKTFARLQPGEQRVKFWIKKLQLMGVSLDVSSSRVKSDEKARALRNIGNDAFRSNRDLAEVAEIYTKNIAYALPGSQELSLAYGNRSAVAFKAGDYEDCLLDIERSLDNNYPEEMTAKLYARRVRCLVVLKKPKSDIEKALQDTEEALLTMDPEATGRDLVVKTLSEKNHMAPKPSTKKKYFPVKPPEIDDENSSVRGANGLAIAHSDKYGRHLVATKDIRPGEVIAYIDSYAHARAEESCYRNCNHCSEATHYGIPCEHCVNVIYCSTSCRDEAWEDYHKNECPIMGVLLDWECPTIVILAVRIASKAVREAGSVEQLKNLVKKIDSVSGPELKGFTGNVFDGKKYASFYALLGGDRKNRHESYLISVIGTVVIFFLATRTEIFGQKYNNGFEAFRQNPLLSFLGGLIIRSCETLELTASTSGDDWGISTIATLCKHHCDSNVTCVRTEKSVTKVPHRRLLYALRPIKAGELLSTTYEGNHYSNRPKSQRQTALMRRFSSRCDCTPCVQNWPVQADLPSVFTMSGLSPTAKAQLSKLNKTLDEKLDEMERTGDYMAAKEVVVEFLEFLYQHACPCKEMRVLRAKLTEIYSLSYHPSRWVPRSLGK